MLWHALACKTTVNFISSVRERSSFNKQIKLDCRSKSNINIYQQSYLNTGTASWQLFQVFYNLFILFPIFYNFKFSNSNTNSAFVLFFCGSSKMLLWLSMILTPNLLTAEPFDLERHEVWFCYSLLSSKLLDTYNLLSKGAFLVFPTQGIRFKDSEARWERRQEDCHTSRWRRGRKRWEIRDQHQWARGKWRHRCHIFT